jgi:FixJ family two-component response regulator
VVKNDKLCLPVPARHSVATCRTAILFDVFLPGEDGPELGREVREESEADIPIVMQRGGGPSPSDIRSGP